VATTVTPRVAAASVDGSSLGSRSPTPSPPKGLEATGAPVAGVAVGAAVVDGAAVVGRLVGAAVSVGLAEGAGTGASVGLWDSTGARVGLAVGDRGTGTGLGSSTGSPHSSHVREHHPHATARSASR